MVSQAFVTAAGVVAGANLVLMMVPQVWLVWRTISVADLSHTFLALYSLGLLLLTFYNTFLELWVFTVACALQLVMAFMLQAGKMWADRWQRHQEAVRLAHSLSLRSGARLDLKVFVAGGAAPFPLLRHAPTHAAQHLLLDARLALPAAPEQGAPAPHAEVLAAAFAAASGLLREAVAEAGLLLQPKLAGAQSQADGTGKGEEDCVQSAFYQCQDGYVAAVWHGATTSLSVDCLAVTEHSMRSMGEAAKAFCAALTERCPGSKVAASSLGRLPASADADAAPIGHAHERKRTPAATASMHWRPA